MKKCRVKGLTASCKKLFLDSLPLVFLMRCQQASIELFRPPMSLLLTADWLSWYIIVLRKIMNTVEALEFLPQIGFPVQYKDPFPITTLKKISPETSTLQRPSKISGISAHPVYKVSWHLGNVIRIPEMLQSQHHYLHFFPVEALRITCASGLLINISITDIRRGHDTTVNRCTETQIILPHLYTSGKLKNLSFVSYFIFSSGNGTVSGACDRCQHNQSRAQDTPSSVWSKGRNFERCERIGKNF